MIFQFRLVLLLLCIASASLRADDYIDLEKSIQEFVLETKKIDIPGHPYAFNPSIIRWNGSLLLSFRIVPDIKATFLSDIGFIWLDDDFNPISEPQILSLRDSNSISPCRAEDARLVAVGKHLFMVYDDNIDSQISRGGFRVFIAELCINGFEIEAINVESLKRFEGESVDLREKSWVPFVYDDDLFLAYSISPHKIFLPLHGFGECLTIDTTFPLVKWKWGELRGGTPGLQIDSDRYLSFFHSSIRMQSVHSNGSNIMHYFMGAYTYSSEPPFALMEMSPEPIIGKNFYNGPEYRPYWKPIRAVFPCGYIFDERHIWIAYGKDDHEVCVVKLDKRGLLDSLIPVKSVAK